MGSGDNNLYAFNPDGTLKWSYTTGEGVLSSPAIGSDGTIYVGSWDKNLYAIGAGAPVPVPEFNAIGLLALVGIMSIVLLAVMKKRK